MSNPEDRYVKMETKTLSNGRVVYKSCRPVSVEITGEESEFVASTEDRMDIIANNVYRSPSSWWKIALANNTVNGTLHLSPGKTIIIPK